MRCEGARLKLCDRIDTVFLIIWRIRLVGRGRTIGNRVTGNTVPEFESLILRQQKGTPFGVPFLLLRIGFELCPNQVTTRLLRRGERAHSGNDEASSLRWSNSKSASELACTKRDLLACDSAPLGCESLILRQAKTAILIHSVAVFVILWYNDKKAVII